MENDDLLQVRLPKEKKKRFLQACKDIYKQDASTLIRAIVDMVLHHADVMANIPSDLPPRKVEELDPKDLKIAG